MSDKERDIADAVEDAYGGIHECNAVHPMFGRPCVLEPGHNGAHMDMEMECWHDKDDGRAKGAGG